MVRAWKKKVQSLVWGQENMGVRLKWVWCGGQSLVDNQIHFLVWHYLHAHGCFLSLLFVIRWVDVIMGGCHCMLLKL